MSLVPQPMRSRTAASNKRLRLTGLSKSYMSTVDDLAHHLDHVDRETKAEQTVVRQNVARGRRGVAGHDKTRANEALREHSGQDRDSVKRAGESCLGARRHFSNHIQVVDIHARHRV